MISSVLERLEGSGGAALPEEFPAPHARASRWFHGGSCGYAAGRVEHLEGHGIALRADRLDEGVLVTPRATAEGDASPEWMVWLADLDIVGDADRDSLEPEVVVSDRAVTLRWRADSRAYRVGVSVTGRPAGQVTFENEAFDGHVELTRTGNGTVATIRPYDGLEAVRIHLPLGAEFRSDPRWTHGVRVTDSSGATHFEDRFRPGEFVVTRPPGTRSVELRFEVAGAPDVAGFWPAPGDERSGAMCLAALRRADLDGWCDAVRANLRIDDASIDGAGLTTDASLWWALAASRDARLESRALEQDVLRPSLRSLFGDLFGLAGPRPLHTVLAGAARHATFGANRTDVPRVAIESAALLHESLARLTELSRDDGDFALARDCERRADELRRWFRRAFWLGPPDRPADVAFIEPGVDFETRVRAIELRPAMLFAASLQRAPLTTRARRSIVRLVEERLLTPHGVRSLDPEDLRFDPCAAADGAAWPWLLATYVEASLEAFGPERSRLRAYGALLDGLGEAPEAWAADRAPAVPIGALRCPWNAEEERRARAALRCGAWPRTEVVA